MNVFSEMNKIVNAIIPVADAFVTGTGILSDVVNLENYNKCTFIVATGASVANNESITVLAGVSAASCATAITFKYRKQIAGVPPAAGSDVPGALTTATTAGFKITASKAGGLYIIEVDAAVVAGGGTDFDHVAIRFDDGGTDAAQVACVIAILSEPRYPQAILATAID